MQDIVDILQFFHENRDKPITSTIALMFLLLVGEKVLRWYFKRQKGTLERKIDLLLRDRGIEWKDAERYSMITFQTKLKNYLLSFWVLPFHALIAKQFTHWRMRRMQISRIWLAGFIAQILGYIGLRFGLTFDNELADDLAGIIILFVIPVITAWFNKTKAPKEVENGVHTENNR